MKSSNSFRSKLSRKMTKYSCMLFKETGILEVPISKYLMVCNAGLVSGTKHETIVDLFSKYSIQQIMMIPGKSYCFVELKTESIASQVINDIHGKLVLPEMKGPLYIMLVEKMPPNSVLKSDPPVGLSIVSDFISDDEEQFLISFANHELANFETAGDSLKHRMVKHYGYVFDYKTNNVDKMNSNCQPIPETLNFIIQRLENSCDKLKHWKPDQLTLNVYQPGQGIPPHVDTHSAFDSIILSLSVGSDIVMDFKNIEGSQFSCLLPRRSLLIIAHESRYGWSHGITPRKYDVVECAAGLTTQERKTRISFTFRRTLDNHNCHCSYSALCDSQKALHPHSSFHIDNEVASELEKIHVHEVYDLIADHFSETRRKPWPNVDSFVKSFDLGSVLVDVGCGNGKYLGNANSFQIGCDRNEKFVSECFQKGYQALICNCLQLPLRSNVVDCCLCIAVIHHLSTEERRIAAVKEIARILRPQGKALIYVWAKNQRHDQNSSSYLKQRNRNKRHIIETDFENHSVQLQNSLEDKIYLPIHVNRTQFKFEDMFVPWKMKTYNEDSKDSRIFLRYYHVFDEGELEKLCSLVSDIEILKSYYDQGNWCVVLQKLS